MRKRILECIIIICIFFMIYRDYWVKTYHNITIYSCSDNIEKEAAMEMIKGESDLKLPKGEGYIRLSFDSEIILKKIEINIDDKTAGILISDTDSRGVKDYCFIENDKWLYDIESTFITIKYNCTKNCIVKSIKIYGEAKEDYHQLNDDSVFLDAYDIANPLSVYRIPIKRGIIKLANDILQKGSDSSNISEHEKILYFMDYIQKFKIGFAAESTSEDYLYELVKKNIGACGDYSNLLAALCATQGIECRLITLANYNNSGHAVLEAKINNHWSMYDSTYNSFYTTTPENLINPYVLSFQELKEGKGTADNVSLIINGDAHIVSDASFDFIYPSIYENANPAGIVSPSNKLYYPISIDYNKDQEGKINLSRMQGIYYIGTGSIGNAQIWTITGLDPANQYELYIKSNGIVDEVGGKVLETFVTTDTAEIINGEKMLWSGDKNMWRIAFIPKKEKVELTLDYVENDAMYLYVSINEIGLTCLNLD